MNTNSCYFAEPRDYSRKKNNKKKEKEKKGWEEKNLSVDGERD